MDFVSLEVCLQLSQPVCICNHYKCQRWAATCRWARCCGWGVVVFCSSVHMSQVLWCSWSSAKRCWNIVCQWLRRLVFLLPPCMQESLKCFVSTRFHNRYNTQNQNICLVIRNAYWFLNALFELPCHTFSQFVTTANTIIVVLPAFSAYVIMCLRHHFKFRYSVCYVESMHVTCRFYDATNSAATRILIWRWTISEKFQ